MNAIPEAPPLARMTGIRKRFGSVEVLHGVDLEIHGGETHVLAGENGAGKSTLIKILAGVYPDFEGRIEIDGRPVRPGSPLEANALGVAVIYQELSLVPPMSVADNLFLGRPLVTAGMVRYTDQRNEARRLLEQLGLEIDVNRPVDELPISVQQLLEIAKALSHGARVIVMDEPTSALNAPEVERLFELIDRLKAQGHGIVYITHKMEEIDQIANRITVLRDGDLVGTALAEDLPTPKLIRWMVGREVDQRFPRHVPHLGDERLRVEDLIVREGGRGGLPAVDGVSLSVRAGEIVGIGGLQGSGASQLLAGLFDGKTNRAQGRVWLDGRPFHLGHPRRSIDRGMAMLTNDRKATGLVTSTSIIDNVMLASLGRLTTGWLGSSTASPQLSVARTGGSPCSTPATLTQTRHLFLERSLTTLGWRWPARERAAAARLGQSLNLRAASLEMDVGQLSGGNQQKVVLAKWLQTQPRLLLLDEPTRGVDVGAKHEVYQLMNEWTSQGIAIILITSEMPELLAMSDRILVMHRGRVTAEFARQEATADRVLEAAMGRLAGS